MCLHPINVKNPSYQGGKYGEHFTYTVPCGYCEECLKARQNSFMIRTREELLKSDYTLLTLTYRNETIPKVVGDNSVEYASLDRGHTALFLNSFRHWYKRKGEPFPRYFLCGEYGSKTFRPHYHLLLGTQAPDALSWACDWWRTRFGLVDSKFVSKSFESFERSARYLAKYTAKAPLENRTRIQSCQVRPYCLHSREWGDSLFARFPQFNSEIGNFEAVSEYVTQQINKTSVGQFRYKLPKYYRKRLQDGILYSAVREKELATVASKDKLIKGYREAVEEINTIGAVQREYGCTPSEARARLSDPSFVFPTRSPLDEANTESRLKVRRLQAESKDRF